MNRMDDKKIKIWMNELRQQKQDVEKEFIQKAIDITCIAHKDLMQKIDASYTEYNLEADTFCVNIHLEVRHGIYQGYRS